MEPKQRGGDNIEKVHGEVEATLAAQQRVWGLNISFSKRRRQRN